MIVQIFKVIITYNNSNSPSYFFDIRYIHIRTNNSSCYSSYKLSLFTFFRQHLVFKHRCKLIFFYKNKFKIFSIETKPFLFPYQITLSIVPYSTSYNVFVQLKVPFQDEYNNVSIHKHMNSIQPNTHIYTAAAVPIVPNIPIYLYLCRSRC